MWNISGFRDRYYAINDSVRAADANIHDFNFVTKFLQIPKWLLQNAVSEKLLFRRLCSRCVHRLLSEEHQKRRIASALWFLTRYYEGMHKRWWTFGPHCFVSQGTRYMGFSHYCRIKATHEVCSHSGSRTDNFRNTLSFGAPLQTKRRCLLSSGVLLLHNCDDLIQQIDHPPCAERLKEFLGGQRFHTD